MKCEVTEGQAQFITLPQSNAVKRANFGHPPKEMPILKEEAHAHIVEAKPATIEVFTGVRMEEAKTGRSKCKGCTSLLKKGEMRVGFETFSGGKPQTSWLHTKCSLVNCRVDIADSNRGKCRVSKQAIKKGQLRFGWRISADSFGYCLPEHLFSTVIPDIFAAAADFRAEDFKGMSLLTPPDRAR